MFKTILLAYDGSTSSASALRCAADLACRYDAKLHLLGIVHTSGTMALAEAAGNDLWGMEKDHLQQAMNLAVIDLGKQGLETIIEIRAGDPAGEIIDYAKAIEAELAVIGHTGKGVLARWFEGSTGAELLDRLPCDLLITTRDA